MFNDEQRLRMDVVDTEGKWPKQLAGSGVMFYYGLKITIDQFRKEAGKMGYRFGIK